MKALRGLVDLVGSVYEGAVHGLMFIWGVGYDGFDLGWVGFVIELGSFLFDVGSVNGAFFRGGGVTFAVGCAGFFTVG